MNFGRPELKQLVGGFQGKPSEKSAQINVNSFTLQGVVDGGVPGLIREGGVI